MQKEAIYNLTVEVQGGTFYSKEVRKVMIKVYQPVIFVQTDKPIYLPGQTGNLCIWSLYKKVWKNKLPTSLWMISLCPTITNH